MSTEAASQTAPVRAVVGLAVLALGTFVFVTTENMPIALLTWMGPSLRTSPERIGFVVTGYAALVAVTSIPLTKLTMRLPRKQLLCGAFAVFTVSSFGAATAANYDMLLASRVAAALGHALFWSLVATTAASLFNGANSGRVIATLFTGGSLGAVVGVPAMTWVGEHAGWRAAFGVVTVIGLFITIALWVLLRSSPRQAETHAVGSRPDRREYRVVLLATAVSVMGIFAAQTYVTLFFTEASHLANSSLSPALLVAGAAGVLGVVSGGWLVARRPVAALVTTLILSGVALLALYPLAHNQAAAPGYQGTLAR
jgi:predicted MFS family arabinose efflux permease